MARIFIVFVSLIIPLFLGGCLDLKQSHRKIEYYMMEYESPYVTGMEPLPVAIKLERFGISEPYDTERIIYRDKSYARNAYVYHKWQSRPGPFLDHFLVRDFRCSGLFKAVFPYYTRFPAAYTLSGSVDEFLEWDNENGREAVLALTVTLQDKKEADVNKRVLLQKSFSVRKACTDRNPQALAKAMSLAMAEISEMIIMEVATALKGRLDDS
ncbi:MAG: membrane integrity-associated transporter subunit PqiC [Desulfobulbaceae bacterium]|nr:membrane integrity-associated transporter subunit PqiC [Desulfobulbaceae bacterium]